jgi:hypothetical protein
VRGNPVDRLLVAALIPFVLCAAVLVELLLRVTTVERLASRLGVPVQLRVPVDEQVRLAKPYVLGRYANITSRAVQRAYRHWPVRRDRQCLRICLVLGFLLRRRRPTMRFGVHRRGGAVVAHAWLVIDGHVIDPEMRRYFRLTSERGTR